MLYPRNKSRKVLVVEHISNIAKDIQSFVDIFPDRIWKYAACNSIPDGS